MPLVNNPKSSESKSGSRQPTVERTKSLVMKTALVLRPGWKHVALKVVERESLLLETLECSRLYTAVKKINKNALLMKKKDFLTSTLKKVNNDKGCASDIVISALIQT